VPFVYPVCRRAWEGADRPGHRGMRPYCCYGVCRADASADSVRLFWPARARWSAAPRSRAGR